MINDMKDMVKMHLTASEIKIKDLVEKGFELMNYQEKIELRQLINYRHFLTDFNKKLEVM